MWHTAIISSTEWDNFFALRCPPGNEATIEFPAQLEFQKVAILMREAMKESKPRYVDYGNWHLPMVGDEEKSDSPAIGADWEFDELVWPRISAGRCAKVSFDTHENYETPTESYVRQTHRLESNGHLSPAEHPATPACPDDDPGPEDFCGNFRGWVQLRKQIPDEDNLVGALEGRENWMDEG